MKNGTLTVVLLSLALITEKSRASIFLPTDASAKVSRILVKPKIKLKFQSASDYGFVLVALKDCTLFIDGRSTTLKPGSYERLIGKRSLELAQSGSTPIPLVLVKVISLTQELTVESTTLAPRQEMEDASDSNFTLLVAIRRLRFSDVRDHADEGEHWKSGSAKRFDLYPGQSAWLKSGMHRLRNTGDSATQFVTIEW